MKPRDVLLALAVMVVWALNFPISKLRFGRSFIRALALVKLGAAKANSELGLLPEKKAEAICQAAREVADLMASMGDMPNSTMRPNSSAIGSSHEKPPTSVPKAIFTPAFIAR